MPNYNHIIKDETADGLRLDRYVSEKLRLLSRSQIKARKLSAKVNGKEVKVSRSVKNGDSLELFWEDALPEDLIPQDLPLDIIYEDENCIVINKEQGMVVHPGAGNKQNTLANAIYYKMLYKKSAAPCSLRPGIVHRLDKDTSGVIIAAFNEEVHEFLSHQFKNRKVRKTYAAIVCCESKLSCKPEKQGKIETFISRDPKDRKRFAVSSRGKTAVTFYKVIKEWNTKSQTNYALVLLRPRTGRTHQLRVHMRYIGCPILGDPIYNGADKKFPNAKLMLHAKNLKITLWQTLQPRLFSAPLPERFKEFISLINKETRSLNKC